MNLYFMAKAIIEKMTEIINVVSMIMRVENIFNVTGEISYDLSVIIKYFINQKMTKPAE